MIFMSCPPLQRLSHSHPGNLMVVPMCYPPVGSEGRGDALRGHHFVFAAVVEPSTCFVEG